MPRSSRRLMLALLALTTLVLSSCGGSSPSPSPTPPQVSGVRGTAVITGGPLPGSPRPGPFGIMVHKGDLNGAVIAKGKSDLSGHFEFKLPPGTYTLVQVSDAARPQTITVEPGKYVTITLTIEAK